ncbi:hypothetical protein DFP72DRAFT_1094451 [Ephemerocybe angulata]|uniref:Uncharacterized protein n=1 Tax=Ephemerocybe angulata TaxID=980116 RepID=A0A8H6I8M8_9AGAR|nr:hypothetical protein DFP72DRAFT_1094451 [Tulosesus angulatus]
MISNLAIMIMEQAEEAPVVPQRFNWSGMGGRQLQRGRVMGGQQARLLRAREQEQWILSSVIAPQCQAQAQAAHRRLLPPWPERLLYSARGPYPYTCVLPTHAVPLRNLLMSDEPRHVLDSYAGLTKTKGVFWTEGIVRAVARAFQPAGVVGYAVRYRKVYVVERRCTPSSMGFVVRRELLRISWCIPSESAKTAIVPRAEAAVVRSQVLASAAGGVYPVGLRGAVESPPALAALLPGLWWLGLVAAAARVHHSCRGTGESAGWARSCRSRRLGGETRQELGEVGESWSEFASSSSRISQAGDGARHVTVGTYAVVAWGWWPTGRIQVTEVWMFLRLPPFLCCQTSGLACKLADFPSSTKHLRSPSSFFECSRVIVEGCGAAVAVRNWLRGAALSTQSSFCLGEASVSAALAAQISMEEVALRAVITETAGNRRTAISVRDHGNTRPSTASTGGGKAWRHRSSPIKYPSQNASEFHKNNILKGSPQTRRYDSPSSVSISLEGGKKNGKDWGRMEEEGEGWKKSGKKTALEEEWEGWKWKKSGKNTALEEVFRDQMASQATNKLEEGEGGRGNVEWEMALEVEQEYGRGTRDVEQEILPGKCLPLRLAGRRITKIEQTKATQGRLGRTKLGGFLPVCHGGTRTRTPRGTTREPARFQPPVPITTHDTSNLDTYQRNQPTTLKKHTHYRFAIPAVGQITTLSLASCPLPKLFVHGPRSRGQRTTTIMIPVLPPPPPPPSLAPNDTNACFATANSAESRRPIAPEGKDAFDQGGLGTIFAIADRKQHKRAHRTLPNAETCDVLSRMMHWCRWTVLAVPEAQRASYRHAMLRRDCERWGVSQGLWRAFWDGLYAKDWPVETISSQARPQPMSTTLDNHSSATPAVLGRVRTREDTRFLKLDLEGLRCSGRPWPHPNRSHLVKIQLRCTKNRLVAYAAIGGWDGK